jgi:hypothetical protein
VASILDQHRRRGGGPADRGLHLGEPVPIGGDHPHAIACPLEERAVDVRPRLVGRDREVGPRDQQRQEVDRERERRCIRRGPREGGELAARHAVKGVAARRPDGLDGGLRAILGGELDRPIGHRLDPLEEVLRRNRERAAARDLGRRLAGHREVEIGRGDTEGRTLGEEQDVGEHGHRALLVRDALATSHEAKEVFLGDDEIHGRLERSASAEGRWRPTLRAAAEGRLSRVGARASGRIAERISSCAGRGEATPGRAAPTLQEVRSSSEREIYIDLSQ